MNKILTANETKILESILKFTDIHYYIKDPGELILIIFKIVISIIIFIIIHKFLKKHISKILKNLNTDVRRKERFEIIIINLFKYLFILFELSYTLNKLLGLPLNMILAFASVGSIAIGLATQNLVKDFITGSLILIENQYNIGDLVKINTVIATVEYAGFRVTKLRCSNGDLCIIPNGSITTVTNMSHGFRSILITLPIPYMYDTKKVLHFLKKEIDYNYTKLDGLLEKPIILGVDSFEATHLNILITGKCEPSKCSAIERQLRLIIKSRLDKEKFFVSEIS